MTIESDVPTTEPTADPQQPTAADIEKLNGALQNAKNESRARQEQVNDLREKLNYLDSMAAAKGDEKAPKSPSDDPVSDLDAELEKRLADAEKKFERQQKALQEKVEAAEKRAKDEEQKTLWESHQNNLNDILISMGVSKKALKAARSLVNDEMDLVDGEYQAVDAKGDVVFGETKGFGKPMEHDELVAKILKDNTYLLAGKSSGSGGTGSGTTTATGAVTITKVEARDNRMYRQRLQEAKERGLSLEVVD